MIVHPRPSWKISPLRTGLDLWKCHVCLDGIYGRCTVARAAGSHQLHRPHSQIYMRQIGIQIVKARQLVALADSLLIGFGKRMLNGW